MRQQFKKGDQVQFRATANQTAVWEVTKVRPSGRYDLLCIKSGRSSDGVSYFQKGTPFEDSPNCGEPGWEKIGETNRYEVSGHQGINETNTNYTITFGGENNTKMNPETYSLASVVAKYKASKLTEPEKSFYELGIADLNGKMNYDGNQLYTEFLFEKMKADFKTEVVDKLLAIKNEKKEDNK